MEAAPVIAIGATLACLWGCATLVLVERRRSLPDTHAPVGAASLERMRRTSKILASVAFVLVAEPALFRDAFGTWMFAGLVLGAIGDAALLGKGWRAFVIGLVAFLLGHLAYVIGIAQIVPPSRWIGGAGLPGVLPVVIAVVAIAKLWPRLGGLAIPVLCYVAAIVAMTIAALAARDGLPAPSGNLLAIGALLFFASDLAVARDRFVERDFFNKLYGLPAYYVGQLLIAWAVYLR